MNKQTSLNELQSRKYIAGVYEKRDHIVCELFDLTNHGWSCKDILDAAENIAILYYWNKFHSTEA